MESNQPTEIRSFFSFDRWLMYTEIIAVIGFLVFAALYTQRGSAEPDAPPISQAEKFLTQADTHYDKQDLVTAVFLYWQALQALETEKTDENKEERLRANLRIAEIYSQSNWLKDAKSRLVHASHIQPDHIDVLLLSGKFLRDEGSVQEAIDMFLAVLEKNQSHAEANYILGVLYQGRREYTTASKHYQASIEYDPQLTYIPSEKAPIGILARLQLSRTYNQMFLSYRFLDRELTSADMVEISRLESHAIFLLEQAIQLKHGTPEIIDDLIRLLYVRANALKREAATRPYADALEVYERIVKLDPMEIQAWEEMGEIYHGFLGDKEKALEMYRNVYNIEAHATTAAIIKSLEAEIAEDFDVLE